MDEEARLSASLQIQGLARHFGGVMVTNDVSLELFHADRVALIGPNGAGKTTLVNLISGHLKPNGGAILLEGRDVTRMSAARRARLGLVRTFQITRLFGSLTVGQNVALPILQRRNLSRRLLSWQRHERAVRRDCEALLEELNLARFIDTPVRELAYGQQRLVDIAIGLALEPRILLLDEPAAGVPHDEAPLILNAIARLRPEIAVMMIEHDMDLVFRFAKRVLVLAEGRLIFAGSPSEVTADPGVRRAYLGSYAHGRGEA
jgi:branched-chain amino acid transport system ATP-binding protein